MDPLPGLLIRVNVNCKKKFSKKRQLLMASYAVRSFTRLIYGFISKEDARSKLLDSPRGTFLLRFSESDVDKGDGRLADGSCDQKTEIYGHLTIAVTELDANEG
jgi:SH2 domain